MKVIVISGMPAVSKNLRKLMDDQPGIEMVQEVADLTSAIQTIERLAPDVAVLDLQMPLKISMGAVRRMLALNPRLKIITLSMYPDCRYLDECLQAGVCGYILKDCAYEELAEAVRAVASGQKYVSKSIPTPLPLV
jgi:DNA-binding NarL/FixJ family response regulator